MRDKPTHDTPPIQSLDRGLAILEAVAASAEPMPLKQLTDLIGIDRSSGARTSGATPRTPFIVLEDPSTVVFGSEPIRHNGSVVGWVTSGGFGYSVNKSIAYAYLPVELAKTGTRVSVECFGIEYQASVEKEPLYDPKGEKIKA